MTRVALEDYLDKIGDLTLKFLRVAKTESPFTLLIQNQEDK